MPECQEPGPLEELRDTVKPYGRHVLAFSDGEKWPAKIEDSDTLLGRMARETKGLGGDVEPKPKFTALRTPPAGDGYDLLVFPDAVLYRGVDAAAWEAIRDRHLREGEVVEELGPEPAEGTHVTVCVHRERDPRCGDCGPNVYIAFQRAIEARGLEGVTVHMSSHVGGHRFAGNVLVYPGGVWYGYVRPRDVDKILDHAVEGAVWEPHYRGEAAPLQ